MALKLGYFGHIARKKMFDVSRYGDRGWPKTHCMDENQQQNPPKLLMTRDSGGQQGLSSWPHIYYKLVY